MSWHIQRIFSPRGSEFLAREDPCDCHLIGVLGFNCTFIPQWLKNRGELVVCSAKGLWRESFVLELSLIAITVDALSQSSLLGVDGGSSSALIWGRFYFTAAMRGWGQVEKLLNFFRLTSKEGLPARSSLNLFWRRKSSLRVLFLYKTLLFHLKGRETYRVFLKKLSFMLFQTFWS